MKFVTAADWHLSARGPASRTDHWADSIFAKLDQVAAVARKIQARAILVPGDVFHEKARLPVAVIYRLIVWCFALKRDGVSVVAIAGNHDLIAGRIDSLPSQPLGLLFACGAMVDCGHRSIPFVEEGLTTYVTGLPYPDATQRQMFSALPQVATRTRDKAILLAHCFAAPAPGSYFGEPIHGYEDLATLPFDVFVFGHDHSDHGVHVVNGKPFVNVGAIARGALAREEVRREPKIAVLDVTPEGIKVTQFRLRVAPAAEVFDLALKAQKDRELAEIEGFVQQLSTDLAVVGPVSFRDRVGGLDLPADVRTRVLAYLEEAERAT